MIIWIILLPLIQFYFHKHINNHIIGPFITNRTLHFPHHLFLISLDIIFNTEYIQMSAQSAPAWNIDYVLINDINQWNSYLFLNYIIVLFEMVHYCRLRFIIRQWTLLSYLIQVQLILFGFSHHYAHHMITLIVYFKFLLVQFTICLIIHLQLIK